MGENFGEFGELQSIRQSFLRQICLTLLFSMVECVLGAKIKFANARVLDHSPKFWPSKITRYTVQVYKYFG